MTADLAQEVLYPPWELFFIFVYIKTQENIKNNIFLKVLRGV